ncbi:MAG: hypothetical protein ABI268_10465 [Rhodanobacter sp.]
MKKTSLLLVMPVVALSGLLLSGCGLFRSHSSWETARQQAPLEIPPTLDRPSTSDALVIPAVGANRATSNGTTAVTGAVAGEVADGFVVTDNVDNAYRRVGEVLQDGKMWQVASHDDATHGYTVNVSGVAKERKGFFSRMFHRKGGASGSTQQVHVTISASGENASEVRAQGNAAAVAKVVDVLKSRLGG